jgi:hypothetical protein
MKNKNPIVIFPIVGNPPTFGTIYNLFSLVDYCEKIYVIIQKRFIVMHPENSKELLDDILCRYTNKFEVIISELDFKNLTEITDDIPDFDLIVTDCAETYTNLASKGYRNVKLMDGLIGYEDSFHRVAYIRSYVLNNIRRSLAPYNFVRMNNIKKDNKEKNGDKK